MGTNERNKDYDYFEPIFCSDCGSKDGEMFKHKYTDRLICEDCLNKKLSEAEAQEEFNTEEERGYELRKMAQEEKCV